MEIRNSHKAKRLAINDLRFCNEPLSGCDGVNFRKGFISPDAKDARKTHGHPAGMAVARLEFIKGDFKHGVGNNFAITAMVPNGATQKVFR